METLRDWLPVAATTVTTFAAIVAAWVNVKRDINQLKESNEGYKEQFDSLSSAPPWVIGKLRENSDHIRSLQLQNAKAEEQRKHMVELMETQTANTQRLLERQDQFQSDVLKEMGNIVRSRRD